MERLTIIALALGCILFGGAQTLPALKHHLEWHRISARRSSYSVRREMKSPASSGAFFLCVPAPVNDAKTEPGAK